MTWKHRRRIAAAWLAAGVAHSQAAAAQTPWLFAGADIYNTHAMLSSLANISSPIQINPRTANKLAVKWTYATRGDVTATPTVEPGGLYVPDWAGWLYKLDPDTGSLIWNHPISFYTGLANSGSRTSPAIGATVVVIGDQTAHPAVAVPGARVVAVNKATGALAWSTVVDAAPYTSVTGSPVIYGNRVFVGLASWDEGVAGSDPKFVPSSRGAIVALDVNTGAILWKFYTVPLGYTGGSSWGSSPAVWPTQQSLLIGTGNNFTIPASATSCVAGAGNNVSTQLACLDPTDYVDSVLALDVATGRLKWSRRLQGADTWTVACVVGFGSCPNPAGVDFDFASAPNLAWVPNFVGLPDDRGGTSVSYLLGAGQKSGIYWALNPVNGGLFWSAKVGDGGIQWGSAIDTDDHRLIFASLENADTHHPNLLAGTNGAPVEWNAGAWGAIDIRTGKMAWQAPSAGSDLVSPSFGSSAGGPNSFTNRVLLTGSSSGYFAALNGPSGRVLWTFNSGASVLSAPAVFNETLYWGTGYAHGGGVGVAPGKPSLFAFRIPPP